MFESTPIIMISIIILSALVGGFIGSALLKTSNQKNNTHTFDIDKTTGIVSDATSVKYHR